MNKSYKEQFDSQNNCKKLYQKKIIVFILGMMIISLIFLSGCQKEEKNEPQPEKKETTEKLDSGNELIVQELNNYTYNKMEKNITEIEKKYKKVKVEKIGKSIAGRNIFLIKLGKGDRKIAVLGGVHGRESITSLLTLKLIEDYARQADREAEINGYQVAELLNKVTFYFIPMLNPDGIEIAINGFPSGEKQKFYIEANEGSTDYKRWKANGRGVDLNKQFAADWDYVDSTAEPHFESYKGSAPESEPESRAVAELTRAENFSAVVAFHHSGNIIYWYYNQTGDRYKKDYQLAKKLSAITGYRLIEPEESDVRAAGFKDWFIKDFKKPGFTIEIEEIKTDQTIPSNRLDEYFKENREVLLLLAKNL